MRVFLLVNGVKGDCVEARHRDWIDVGSWSWSLAAGSTPPRFSTLSLTCLVGRHSPVMFALAAQGALVPTPKLPAAPPVALEVVRSTDYQILAVRFELFDVRIAGLVQKEGWDGGHPEEEWALSYGRLRMSWTGLKVDGGADTPVTKGWDVKNNRAF